MSAISEFVQIENKHGLYRGKDCMKVLWIFKRTRKKYNWFWKGKMLPLTKEELKSHQHAKVCYICGKTILHKLAKNENYQEVRHHYLYTDKYRGAAHSNCNLKFNVPNLIPVDFHNGSNYDNHFITNELVNKFDGKFGCLGENTKN